MTIKPNVKRSVWSTPTIDEVSESLLPRTGMTPGRSEQVIIDNGVRMTYGPS